MANTTPRAPAWLQKKVLKVSVRFIHGDEETQSDLTLLEGQRYERLSGGIEPVGEYRRALLYMYAPLGVLGRTLPHFADYVKEALLQDATAVQLCMSYPPITHYGAFSRKFNSETITELHTNGVL